MIHWKRLIRSFGYAFAGLAYALATQQNMRIHFVIATIAILATIVLDVSKYGMIAVFFSIVLVICMELVNTAIEKTIDYADKGVHPFAKIAKDTAAAAVLLAALNAIITGYLVFSDCVFPFRIRHLSEIKAQPLPFMLAVLGFMIVVITVLGALQYRKSMRK
ncbi:diacylglycerol kinase family protein [Fodinisporobacter ferrooxydans]|uniref:Diacylglycerol kinase family protein n=1 Tax=Fodinisporobacter ferrooxydans TaxID=2901836 RepID=A0ABY4CHL3_9BACL|nr:diacylglycerol kinase family protein [Alicyclobacillaceae bacterium MYW30-H2]